MLPVHATNYLTVNISVILLLYVCLQLQDPLAAILNASQQLVDVFTRLEGPLKCLCREMDIVQMRLDKLLMQDSVDLADVASCLSDFRKDVQALYRSVPQISTCFYVFHSACTTLAKLAREMQSREFIISGTDEDIVVELLKSPDSRTYCLSAINVEYQAWLTKTIGSNGQNVQLPSGFW